MFGITAHNFSKLWVYSFEQASAVRIIRPTSDNNALIGPIYLSDNNC